jgi:uncharacterized protein
MLISEARVETERPGRYLAQLCKHFARKVHAEWTDERGRADFGWGTCSLVAADGALLLRAEAPDTESLERVEYVVGDHTQRFGARDGLSVSWSREPAG